MNIKIFFKTCILIITFSSLISCVPALFTGAAVSTYTLSKDKTATQTVNDIRIASAIKASFIKNNFKNLYSKITVEVSNGRVLYVGTVSREQDIIDALKVAWAQNGVTEVINNLEVDENNSHFKITNYAQDTLITTQVKSKLLTCKDIKFVNYNILTYNGVVYIFGQARSVNELEQVAGIAAKVKGVSKVVDHVRML